jgi:Ca-activated chloride channel family protein
MQRWQLTTGLAGLAILGVILVPRLTNMLAPPVPQPTNPAPIPVHDSGTALAPQVAPGLVDEPIGPRGHLTVTASLDRTAVMAGQGDERFLAIHVSAPQNMGREFRRPVDLAVVMDASGSMSARGKIDYAKRAAKLLASSMEPGDFYSLVTFSDDASTIVPATHIADPTPIHRAIDRVLEGGGTNLYAGIDKGAGEIKRTLHGENVGRVIVLSDGNANVGVTDASSLTKFTARLAKEGVTVSTIGLGLDYNEDVLGQMADMGGGTYDFVDDPRELERVFRDELNRSASVVARNTQITVDLPEGVRGLEIIGWDASPSANGWTINLGDVYAGETRKIIAKVRVTGEGVGSTMQVATATANYLDTIDGVTAVSSASASAIVTRELAVVTKSVNREASVAATRAYGNWFLDQSTRAYAKGDNDEAQALAGQGAAILSSGSVSFDAPELEEDADDLRSQEALYDSYSPSSAEGRRSIKLGKEKFRGRARR